MTPFVVRNLSGEVIRYGRAPESQVPLQAQEGEIVTVEEFTPAPVAIRGKTYVEYRVTAYPPIGDQLDALWKGGEALAAMQQQILAVKAAHPKPQEGETV